MNLVLTMLVRDEEDLVADNMSYHLDAGADLIIVTDNGSVDSTRDIVQTFVDDGTARLLVEPAPIHSQWRWVTRMARTAYWDHNADWVINTDADEFWWPESGNLKDVLGAVEPIYGAVRVPRFDFRPLTDVGGGPRETPYRETASLRFIGGALEPKTCHRADPRVIVGQGNHEVSGGSGIELDGSGLLSVFHFPTRSREQFRRGVGNAGAAYKRSTEFVPTTGEVKRALYESLESGDLDEVFGSRELAPGEAEAAIRSGKIVEDRRLLQELAASKDHKAAKRGLVVVSLDGIGSNPIVAQMSDKGYTIRETTPIEIGSSSDAAAIVAIVPTPTEWVERSMEGDVDLEEAAYEWVRAVSAIAGSGSRVLWISPSRSGAIDTSATIAAWLEEPTSLTMLDEIPDDHAVLSASTGPSFALAMSVYALLRTELELFRPLARLIHAITTDDQLASRLSWYLGPPGVGTDLVGEWEERLAGVEASYDALLSRRSVSAALKVAEVPHWLGRAIGRRKRR